MSDQEATPKPVPSPDPEDEEAALRRRISELEARVAARRAGTSINIRHVPIVWDTNQGSFTFLGMDGLILGLDITLAALLSNIQAMVGPERFALCLQGESRKGVSADISFFEQFPDFETGFRAYAETFAVAGWGRWEFEGADLPGRQARFRVWDSWEGRQQLALGVSWGSPVLAGKLAGLGQHLFKTPCWAEQTSFMARGDAYDGFLVSPSRLEVEAELQRLLASDEPLRKRMTATLEALRQEVHRKIREQQTLERARKDLERRVAQRARELASANDRLVEEITEKKRAEELFRRIAEMLPQPLAILEGPDFRPVYGNPAIRSVVGYSNSDTAAAEPWFRAAHPDPEDRARAWQRFLSHIPGPGQKTTFESRIRCAWGEDRDLEFQLLHLGPDRHLLMARDLTELRRATEERERLAEQLHRAQKMAALGMLASGVAHDLNNLLSGIVTYPDLLLDSLPDDSPLRGPITVTQQAGLQAAAVVEDLVTLARGVAVPRTPCDVNQIVERYLASPEFMEACRRHPQARLETSLSPDLLHIKAAPTQLRKTLANLVLNALEALTGPGRVRIGTRNCYIDAPLPGYDEVAIGEYVVLAVEDDGPGIPADYLGRVFEPFFTRKAMGRSGTGLGLAVVWNAVREHEGYIQLRSEPGGTCFELFFPTTRSPGTTATPSDVTISRGRGERILVVDDEASQREIACQLLTSLGYQAQAAASGEEAVGCIQRQPFDLVLLDMIMRQGLDGRATYERILEVRPGQKAVIASGHVETEDVRAALNLGAGAFLRKPYRAGLLGITLRRVLDGPTLP